MQNASVGARARLGAGCLINTGAIVEHDNVLGDYVFLGPRAVLGGDCTVGHGAAIGIGAVVRHGMSIGADTVVGGAAYVDKNFGDGVVAYGVPAKVVRRRTADDPYL
jgi:carbonic anhydrase/acetyltransferase-like protein (isoleucine patch superfamily)